MKNYYVELNGQQSDALSFEELKDKNITRDTLVWYEGLDGWKKAGSLDELQQLFKSFPPPIKKETPPPVYIVEEKPSFMSENRNKILLVSLSFVLLLVLFFSFNDRSKTDMEIKTRENSYLIDEQQKQLEEQKAKIAEQERLEKERAERERQDRIKELTALIIAAEQNVENAKRQLNDATSFQMLRSRGERNDEINAANENLEARNKELDALVKELEKLNPEN